MWLLSVFTAEKIKPSISAQTLLVHLEQGKTLEDGRLFLLAGLCAMAVKKRNSYFV